MCTKDSIHLFSLALTTMRGLATLYMIFAGSIIVNNFHLAQAFGGGVTVIGAFVIVCGFINVGNAVLGHGGHNRHNKFIILVAVCLDLVLLGVQATLGSVLYSHTISEYDISMQTDCLRSEPTTYTADECLEYIRSDRYAALMLVWRSYTYLSLDYIKYYQRVVALENGGSCCGYGPPTGCTDDSRSFPSWASTNNVGWDVDERYICGEEADWYEETYFCSQYVDETAVFPVIGGCQYDYALGDCMDVTVVSAVKGCAAELEVHMTNKIIYHSYLILGITLLMAVGILSSCCMLWKRSREDTLPDHVDRHVPWDPYAPVKGGGSTWDDDASLGSIRAAAALSRKQHLDNLVMGELPGAAGAAGHKIQPM